MRDYFGRLAEIVEDSRVESVEVIDVDQDQVIAVAHMFGKTANFDQDRGQLGLADQGEGRQGHAYQDLH